MLLPLSAPLHLGDHQPLGTRAMPYPASTLHGSLQGQARWVWLYSLAAHHRRQLCVVCQVLVFLNSGILGVWAEAVLHWEDLHFPTVPRRMFTILGLNMSEDPLPPLPCPVTEKTQIMTPLEERPGYHAQARPVCDTNNHRR